MRLIEAKIESLCLKNPRSKSNVSLLQSYERKNFFKHRSKKFHPYTKIFDVFLLSILQMEYLLLVYAVIPFAHADASICIYKYGKI